MAQQTINYPHSQKREGAIRANRVVYSIARHWLLGFSLVYGLYIGLPFIAPVLMNLGLETPARVIYMIYSFLCHQLPQRSFFLFGERFTYPLEDILAAWNGSADAASLRQFIGNPVMGWKVAWSDRMVSMYSSILLFAWLWYPIRKSLPRLRWQGLLLFILPMAVDGISHLVSDLAGMGTGYRETNLWLSNLTGQAFPDTFYAGNAWGSFNSLMRLVTGTIFGAGIVWYGFPYLEEFFNDIRDRIEWKFHRAGIKL